ncbi:MAG: hydrolase [Ilumatobacteraceae bacterium]|nr:hydrolase [Ilumatobacteraceae bacterium]
MTDVGADGNVASCELLDAFDDGLQPLGPVGRDVVHRDGLWHQVFHCLIVRTSAPPRVLLQRRRASARSFGGLLDLSATGHLHSGEAPVDGVRELYEELGVAAARDDVVPLGRRLMIDDAGEGHNREIIHSFLLGLDMPLEAFDLRDRDVDGLVEIEIDDLLRILVDPDHEAPSREVDLDGLVTRSVCRSTDLVPAVDGYWTVIAIMAQRFVDGVGPLAI